MRNNRTLKLEQTIEMRSDASPLGAMTFCWLQGSVRYSVAETRPGVSSLALLETDI